ncbi:MAG: PEP/pyruvate-binding domain-containing protein, partial [Acidimicrobiia bacterium]
MSLQTIQRLDNATDPASAGAKAAALALLADTDETIPDGFVITVDATRSLESSELVSAVGDALTRIGALRVAVRSSGVEEDLVDASHAGEYLSLLGVSAQAGTVLDAARRVVASADGTPMAVLVQAMVDATVAGAAFSSNPVTGDAEVMVSAVDGLADRLMEGSTTGDEWIVRNGKARHISGGNTDQALILDVAALAERLAERQGYPVDIEWAHDGETLHLLQCRPITALPTQPAFEIPEGSWQKDTTHYPTPVSPLVASGIAAESEAIARWMARSGLILEKIDEVSLGGEIYSQPVPVGGGGSGKPPPRFVMGIVVRLHPALRSRMGTAKEVVASGSLEDSPRKWREEWKPEMTASVAGFRAIDVTTLDDGSLLAHIDELFAFSAHALGIHFDLMLPYVVAIHDLVTTATTMLGWDENQVLRLLSGHSPASSGPTTAMRGVAGTIRQSSAAMAALDGPDDDLIARISAVDADSGDAVANWVDTYGFRSTQYDWSSLTIAEQPGLIARMIRAEVENETTLLSHDDVEAEARAALSPSDVREFDDLLSRARDIYPVREDNIHWTYTAQGALLRRAYLEVGRRLATRDIIGLAEDVFMLEQVEVARALTDSEHDSLTDLARRRRAERAWVATHPGPAFLGDPPGAPPDIGAFPAAGRRLNQALLWTVEREFGAITPTSSSDGVVAGIPGAAGVHTGTARTVRSEADFTKVQQGDVVICPITNPSWSVLFGIA